MIRSVCSLALLSLPAVPAPPAEEAEPRAGERAAIERAILDYAESYYEARPEYVERGISKELVKLGFKLRDDGTYEQKPMDYDGFARMVQWVVDNGRPEPGPKEVVVLDALDRTALVKLTGSWGIDHMQVVKEEDGRWRTRHVLWQTFPPASWEGLGEAERAAEAEAVEAAVRDYLEALYAAEPERIERSVHPELVKHGFWEDPESGEWRASTMTFEQLVDLAGRWNASGWLPEDAPRGIEVLDVLDKIACAKLSAHWGVDYMHLAKEDGRWRIRQVLWQSAPAEEGS